MDQLIFNEILPTLIFFIVFSIFFSVLELVVILVLNQLERKNWEWVVDVLIRSEVHHKKIIRYTLIIALGVLFIILITSTPLVPILTMASGEFRLFALLLALVMLLIYSINIRKSTKISIEKKIYGIVFFVISLLLYFLIIITAYGSYKSYVEYVNKHFIKPAVTSVETVLEEREKNQLLSEAHQAYQERKCNYVDYTKEQKKILIKNMVLISSEPELAFRDKAVNIDNPEESLKGMSCTSGEDSMLLIENGNWYFVREEYIKFIK